MVFKEGWFWEAKIPLILKNFLQISGVFFCTFGFAGYNRARDRIDFFNIVKFLDFVKCVKIFVG